LKHDLYCIVQTWMRKILLEEIMFSVIITYSVIYVGFNLLRKQDHRLFMYFSIPAKTFRN